MDPVKRQTILTEIEHWRTSRLLPEQYCDFLRNLYIEDSQTQASAAVGRTNNWKASVLTVRNGIAVLGASLILILFIYFTSFSAWMQISLALSLVASLYGIGFANRKRSATVATLCYGVASILLLLFGEWILKLNEWHESYFSISILACCGVVWLVVGWLLRIALLHVCGWMSLLFAYVWLIQFLHAEPGWLILQAYTAPVALLLFALGKRPSDKGRRIALFVAAAAFWFAAEAYGILLTEMSGIVLHPSLALKMMLAGIALWSLLRKPNPAEWTMDHD